MVGSNGTLGRGSKQHTYKQNAHRRNSYAPRKISDESEVDTTKGGFEPSLKFNVHNNSRNNAPKNENGPLTEDVYNNGGHALRYVKQN